MTSQGPVSAKAKSTQDMEGSAPEVVSSANADVPPSNAESGGGKADQPVLPSGPTDSQPPRRTSAVTFKETDSPLVKDNASEASFGEVDASRQTSNATESDAPSPGGGTNARSTRNGEGRRDSSQSVFDPWEDQDYQACGNQSDPVGLHPDLKKLMHQNSGRMASRQDSQRSVNSSGHRKTIFAQASIASQISLPFRILGVVLAFFTIIFIWEATELLMFSMFPKKDIRLIAYIALSLLAALALAISHHWVYHADAQLMPSYAYALSTLYLAMGTWGIVIMVTEILVPGHKLFCYTVCAILGLLLTVFYGLQTKHNVFLDIVSCANTLGLHDEWDDEEAIGLLTNM